MHVAQPTCGHRRAPGAAGRAGTRDRPRGCTPGLHAVHVPTLVVHGLADDLVRFSGGVATARAVPGLRPLAFPGMGHDLPGPRRREFVSAIVRNAERAS